MSTADTVFAVLYFASMIVVSLVAVWYFRDEVHKGRSVTLFDLFVAVCLALLPIFNIVCAIMGVAFFVKEWGSEIVVFRGRRH